MPSNTTEWIAIHDTWGLVVFGHGSNKSDVIYSGGQEEMITQSKIRKMIEKTDISWLRRICSNVIVHQSPIMRNG